MTDPTRPGPRPLVVVMGVSGSGKSTVGAALAQRLRVPFGDADDFHPPANIAKMSAGHALDDADREPWLEAIGAWLAERAEARGGVVTCSALKRAYRDRIRESAPTAVFVHLAGSRAVIAARQASRPGHFMPASLLDSQFATLEDLEPDEAGFVVDVRLSVDDLVDAAAARLAVPTPDPAGAPADDQEQDR
ncbi:gluconokinase [Nocardioides sp. ChNu-99]|uniref:gluconokinase n=1 Tax=Nocardioides sp. ChNu-99 TaxID=2839897 RepID=UPI0024062455|nr:gluconokinase [Nocardioides sp. ChNu-99]